MIIQPIAIDWQNATENLLTTGTITGLSLTATSLTPTHVVYAGTAGLLSGSANLTFVSPDLTCAGDIKSLTNTLKNGTNTLKTFSLLNGYVFQRTDATQTALRVFPYAAGVSENSLLQIYNRINSFTSPSAGEFLGIEFATTHYRIYTMAIGAGYTIHPLRLYTGTNTSQLILNTTGTSSFGGFLRIGSDVAPTVALDVTGAALISTTLGVNDLSTLIGGISLPGGAHIALDTITGTKIGTATNQLLGFYNATPVVQQTGIAAQKINYTAGDLDSEAEIITALNTTNAAINTLRTALNNLGLTTTV